MIRTLLLPLLLLVVNIQLSAKLLALYKTQVFTYLYGCVQYIFLLLAFY